MTNVDPAAGFLSSRTARTSKTEEMAQPEDESEWDMFKDHMRFLTLQEIEERYAISSIISRNPNATVRLAIHHITGDQVAIKILNKTSLRDSHKKLLLLREIKTLDKLGESKHITELYEVIDSGDRIWIVMEYASGGELFDFVKAKAPLSDSLARDVFRPIIKVVAYMHSLNLVHRDLKLENVLLDIHGRIRLADFGFSREFDKSEGLVDSICGTAHYSPPEVIRGQPHDPILLDSWSLGVILYLLLFGTFPFTGLSIPEVLQAIMKASFTFPFKLSDLAEDLINKLLAEKPSDRLVAAEVLNHPWINKNRMPHPPKPNQKERVNNAAMQEVKNLGIVKDGQEDMMDTDQRICYRLVRRKYQLGSLQLPSLNQNRLKVNLPEFHAPSNGYSSRRCAAAVNPVFAHKTFPCGMDSGKVRQRLTSIDTFLHIKRYPFSVLKKKAESAHQNSGTLIRDLRKDQTMRFRTLCNGQPELPKLECKHTTLDPPELLFEKLLAFMAREPDVYIICEHDFALFVFIAQPRELYLSITMGCVHRGFNLIGFSLNKIRGDEYDFLEFEQKLTDYIGF